jgi:hypothetical protein
MRLQADLTSVKAGRYGLGARTLLHGKPPHVFLGSLTCAHALVDVDGHNIEPIPCGTQKLGAARRR